MTNLDIDAIREREQKATAGPWKVEPDARPDVMTVWRVEGGGGYFNEGQLIRSMRPYIGHDQQLHIAEHAKYPNAGQDADFIAHARTDIPALLAEVDRLQACLNRADEATSGFRQDTARLFANNAKLQALVTALATRHPMDDLDKMQAELMLDPEYRVAYIAEVERNNRALFAENHSLRALVGELVAACELFSHAHTADMAMGEATTDPQDWAEFDQAVTKAREALGAD